MFTNTSCTRRICIYMFTQVTNKSWTFDGDVPCNYGEEIPGHTRLAVLL